MNHAPHFDEIDLLKAQTAIAPTIGDNIGELFVEKSNMSALVFDQNRLAQNTLSRQTGMGLRKVVGTETTYAHSESISKESVNELVSSISHSVGVQRHKKPQGLTTHNLYQPENQPELTFRLKKINEINETIRALDQRIINVTVSMATNEQKIAIVRSFGDILADNRPMAKLSIAVVVEENGRRESGNAGKGGRYNLNLLLDNECWLALGKEALRIALLNLTAQPCPAGEQMLLVGSGWPGVLFHEAVGHGLEGDFNRKGSSAFSTLKGKRIAANGVRVIDDGTIESARGSINFDDEGQPTQRNVLIEDGILVKYMNDRLNGEAMSVGTSGNCRRESYAHAPMPRMTNTFLDNGDVDHNSLFCELKDGIYAVGFGGGQVDITSGKFVFNCTEAYRVQNGEILYPVKGATLIGDGPTALQKIIGVGNDMSLDPGIGNCGKAGQWLPVCVGQPSVLMNGITVGGTEMN